MKRKNYSDSLNRTLESIGRYDLTDDFAERPRAVALKPKRGPSKWLEMKDDRTKYGKDFDFRVLDGDVFMPACEVAQQWVYYVLPEGLDAYTDLDGWVGYHIPAGIDIVLDAAWRDNLLNEADYVANMANDELMRQGMES